MDVHQKLPLNNTHVFFLVQNGIIGMSMLSLSNTLSPIGSGHWIIPILFGLLVTITVIGLVKFSAIFPEQHLFQVHDRLFGPLIGSILNFTWLVYFIALVYIVSDNYLALVELLILPNRTQFLPFVVVVILEIFIVKGGVKSVARFCIATFFLTAWMIVFLKWGFTEGTITHVLPVFNFTWREFWEVFKPGYSSLLGFELLLLYYPLIQQKKKTTKLVIGGVWTSIFFYVAVTFVGSMYFSQWQLENVKFPLLKLFQAVNLTFIERIDTLGISLWVLLILSTGSLYLWGAKLAIDHFRSKETAFHLYILGLIVILLTFIPIEEPTKLKIQQYVFYVGYVLVILPILCIPLAKRAKRREHNA
ncbi:GerAB/ArcD/ProY family transporter [Paenisporosarcina cavernae]|uniref:Spore gernimation protein n=1 Tax=Paenisporosarcina cavernae TaxID=2320858 RepID=A0A385YQI4_9BACL|nr:GerAB/ArcD/ProY family transporter [Paenisporosarcina cavernae]AYC28620.1 spore gernimation protein [Paenisporosarcina cavernae]